MSAQQDAMQVFVGKLVGDMGAAFTAPLNVLGDRLGLFAALAEIGPATADAVASHTGLFPRYVREWLAAQAAAGNVTHVDGPGADGSAFALSPEQRMAFADQNSPVFMPGAYEVVTSMFKSLDRMECSVPVRRRGRLGRARSLPVPRHRAVLQARLRGQPGVRLAAGLGRRASQA